MTTFKAPAPHLIPARWHGGKQDPRRGLITIHSAVTPCRAGMARAVARDFATTETKKSAHYSVDPGEVIQSVGDHTIAYHCGHNDRSLAVELCEMPSKINLARWYDKAHRQMVARAVRLVAELCLAYDIPPYYVDAKGLRAGRSGITTHNEIRLAFPGVTTHWDPGAWPRYRFMRAVRAEIARIRKAAR